MDLSTAEATSGTAEPAASAGSAGFAASAGGDPVVVRLGSWPTPLEPAPRLAERIGLRPADLWIKRDDLTGLAGGGNKVRKLEHTAGSALAAGADTLVPIGSRGYLGCARELTEQAPDLAHVVVSVGSGGTMAGLVAGLGAARVLGVDSGAVADPARRVREMVTGLGGSPEGLRLRGDQVGDGYGRVTDAARRAMSDVARTEGLALDPVYTAKASPG
jgi:D-cysteine desulfhydrase